MQELKLKIFKLIKIIQSKNYYIYKAFLRYFVSPSYEHLEVFKKKKISTFIDIGANKGQFSLLANQLYPKAIIYAIEPLEYEYGILKRIFQNKHNINLFNLAVGNKNTRLNIFITKKRDSSSLLLPTNLQLDFFSKNYLYQKKKVLVRKLNIILKKKKLKKKVFLKIDTQGYELEILKSFNLEKFVDYIYLEASSLELYKKQPTFKQIKAYLEKKKFKHIKSYNVIEHGDKLLQGDFLFFKVKTI